MVNDTFTKQEVFDIMDENQTKIGSDVITYRMVKIPNAKNLIYSDTYAVTVTHRILVDGSGWTEGGDYQSEGFTDYPIILNVESGIKQISDTNANIEIKKVFPKTINATVEQSSNQSTGSSTSQMYQSSSGSSMSNVNTFGIDLSGGFFGDQPTGSIGVQYSHSWDHTTFNSAVSSHSKESDLRAASGNEMSVKDWSAYSSVQNFDNSNPNYLGEFVQWKWGQTYPWNIFEYSNAVSESNILLPQNVQARLLYEEKSNNGGSNQYILLPPSELSLFGLDFTMAAQWYVTFPQSISSFEALSFHHEVKVTHGSHQKSNDAGGGQSTLLATIADGYTNPFSQLSSMSLSDYALLPFAVTGSNTYGVGFQTGLFDIVPTSKDLNFKIRSRSNNLLVTGNGFDNVMTANFASGYSGSGATMSICFKVLDVNISYSLILKHWKGSSVSGNLVLTCKVNGLEQTTFNVIDSEGQGYTNNIDQLDLRNFDLKSSNYHDYLKLGWNEVEVTIRPADTSVASKYYLLALSVEA